MNIKNGEYLKYDEKSTNLQESFHFLYMCYT